LHGFLAPQGKGLTAHPLHAETPASGAKHWHDLSEHNGGLIKGQSMLSYAITFLLIAIIAGVLGFVGIAGFAAEVAKILFVVFLVLFCVSLLAGRRPPV
jgi:uncharacterized membrane protein YtjA (UPF0391 family)